MLQRCVGLKDSDCKNKKKKNNIRTKREVSRNPILKKSKRRKEKKKNKKARKEKNIKNSQTKSVPVIKAKTSNAHVNNDHKVPKYLEKLFKNLQGVEIEIVEICSDDFISTIQYFIKADENLATSLEKVLNYHPEFNSIYCDKKKSSFKITYVNDRNGYWSEINNSRKCHNFSSLNVDNFDDQYIKRSSNDLKLLCGQYCKFVSNSRNGLESSYQKSKKSKDFSNKIVDNQFINSPSDSMSIGGGSIRVDEGGYESSNNNRNFEAENQHTGRSDNSLSNKYLTGNENKQDEIEDSNQYYEKLFEIFANNDLDKLQTSVQENDQFWESSFQNENYDIDSENNNSNVINKNPKCVNDDNKNDYEDVINNVGGWHTKGNNEHNSVKNMQKTQKIPQDSVIGIADQFNSEPIYNFASIDAVNQLDNPIRDHEISEEFDFDDEHQNPANFKSHHNLKPSKISHIQKENMHLVDNHNDLDYPTINYHSNVDFDGEFRFQISDSSPLKPESMIDSKFPSSNCRESLKNNDAIVDESTSTKHNVTDLRDTDQNGDEFWKGIHDYILDHNYEQTDILADEYLDGDDNATMDDDIDATEGQNDNETNGISAKSNFQEVANSLGGDINNDEHHNTNKEANINVDEWYNISGTDLLSYTNQEANRSLDEQFNIEPSKVSAAKFLVEGDNAVVKNDHDEYQNTNHENYVNADEQYQSGLIDKTAIENLRGFDTAADNENSNTTQEFVNTEDQYINGPVDLSPTKPQSENYFESNSHLTANGNDSDQKGDDEGFENIDSYKQLKIYSPAELNKINRLGDSRKFGVDKTSSAIENLKDNVEDLLNDISKREKLSVYNLETENAYKDAEQNISRNESSDELDNGNINLYIEKEELNEVNDENINLVGEKEELKAVNDENINLVNRRESSDERNDGNINLINKKECSDEVNDQNINLDGKKEELNHGNINLKNKKESSDELNDANNNVLNRKDASDDVHDKHINLNNTKESSVELIDENINLSTEKDSLNRPINENINLINKKVSLNLNRGNINLHNGKEKSNELNGDNNNIYNGKDVVNPYNSKNGYLPYVHPGIHGGNGNLYNGNPTGNINWLGVKNDGYPKYQKENSNRPHYENSDFDKGKGSLNLPNDLYGANNVGNMYGVNNGGGNMYGANNVGGYMYGANNGHAIWNGAYNGGNPNGINGGHGGYIGGVGNMHGTYNPNGLYGHNGVIGIPPEATGNPYGNNNGFGNLYGVTGGKDSHYGYNDGNAHFYGPHNGNKNLIADHSKSAALEGVEINSVKSITEKAKIPPQTTGFNDEITKNNLNSPFIHPNYINGDGQNYYHDRPQFSNTRPPNTYNGYMNGFDYANYQKHNVFLTKYPNPIGYTAKYASPNDYNAKYQNQNDIVTNYQNQNDFTANYQHQNDIGKYNSLNDGINDGLAQTEIDTTVIPNMTNTVNGEEKKHSLKIEINNKPYLVGELPRNAFDSLYEKTKDIIPAKVDEQDFEKYFNVRSMKKAETSNEDLTKKETMDSE